MLIARPLITRPSVMSWSNNETFFFSGIPLRTLTAQSRALAWDWAIQLNKVLISAWHQSLSLLLLSFNRGESLRALPLLFGTGCDLRYHSYIMYSTKLNLTIYFLQKKRFFFFWQKERISVSTLRFDYISLYALFWNSTYIKSSKLLKTNSWNCWGWSNKCLRNIWTVPLSHLWRRKIDNPRQCSIGIKSAYAQFGTGFGTNAGTFSLGSKTVCLGTTYGGYPTPKPRYWPCSQRF